MDSLAALAEDSDFFTAARHSTSTISRQNRVDLNFHATEISQGLTQKNIYIYAKSHIWDISTEGHSLVLSTLNEPNM